MKLVLALCVAALALASSASASSAPGFLGCKAFQSPHSRLERKPASIVVACADAGFYFTKLHWVAWTRKLALATGTANANDCTPNCAAGHFHRYPARVSLHSPKTCHGRTEFTKLAWTFTRARPAGMARSGSQTFPCA